LIISGILLSDRELVRSMVFRSVAIGNEL